MSIRPATPNDAQHVAFHRYPDELDAAQRPPYATWVAGAIQRGLYLGFLALDGENVTAGAGLTLLEWGPSRGDPQPWRARLVNVWTHPEYRRGGLARELVLLCLKAVGQRGISRVQLGTSEMARPLYHQLGFQDSGTEMWLVLRETVGNEPEA